MKRAFLITAIVACMVSLTEARAQGDAKNDERIVSAREAIGAGDYQGAIVFLENALKDNAENGYAYYELAWAYRGQKELLKARECIEKAIKLIPKTDDEQLAHAYDRRGTILDDDTEYELALEAFRMAVFAAPNHMPFRVNMAKTLIELDRIDEAEKELKYMLEKNNKNVEALSYLGLICMINDNYDLAYKHLNNAVRSSEKVNIESLIFRSNCEQGLGLFIEAVNDLLQALAADPSDKRVLDNLAAIAGYENNLTTVVNSLRKKQESEPALYIWSYFIGYVYHVQGMQKESIAWYEAANKITEKAMTFEAMAECYQDLEDLPNALKMIDNAATKDTSAFYFMARGDVYKHFNEYIKAIKEYEKYLKKVPSSAMANHKIASCNLSMNYFTRALENSDKAVKLMTRKNSAIERGQILYLHALSLQKKGKLEDAKKDFEEILKIRGAAPYTRAVAYARLGKKADALNVARGEYEDRKLHYMCAAIFSIFEEYNQALNELESSLDEREVSAYSLVSNPDLDNIRDTERFLRMVQKALGTKWGMLEEQKKQE